MKKHCTSVYSDAEGSDHQDREKFSFQAFLKKYIPLPALFFYLWAVVSLVLLLIAKHSVAFSDFFCHRIAAYVRMALSKITGFLPFSLAEAIILCIPLWIALLLWYVWHLSRRGEDLRLKRFFVTAFACVSLFFSLFVFTYGTGYYGKTLDDTLGVETSEVSVEELKSVALFLTEEVNTLAKDQTFIYGSFSVMPYDLKTMNEKLNRAYASICKDMGLLAFTSKVKSVMISESMSYAHLLGMYTYYTGEANINVNFPDYTTPFTAAHEMSHQRGFSRENEANFMAFLVCSASEDSYIRYCGYLNLLDYIYDALYSADKSAYSAVLSALNLQTKAELSAYGEFFQKYASNKAATVSGTLNDAFLKGNGQSAGTKSYGLVVDLAVAYFRGAAADVSPAATEDP